MDRTELLQRRKELLMEKRRMLLAQQGPEDSPDAIGGVSSVRLPLKEMSEREKQEREQAKWINQEIEAGRINLVPPTYWQRFKSELPQMGGGMAGGLAGAKLGAKYGPLGAFAGGVGGAVFGGMGGKGYQQLYRIGKGEPMTLGQIYKEQTKAGIEEGVSEAAGYGIGKIGGKIFAPLKSKLIPSAPKLGRKLTEAGTRLSSDEISTLTPYAQRLLKKKGVFLTAAQATESRGMDFVESATESTIFGGNRIFQIKKVLQPKAYKQVVRELSEEFWEQAGKKLSPEEVGQLFVDTVTGNRELQRRLERMAYGQVDQLTKGAVVDFRPVKQKALEMVEQAAKSKGLGSSSGINRIASRVSKLDDVADSFMDAHAIRSNILEEARKLEGILNTKLPKVNRATETLAGEIDDAMARAAKAQSPQAYDAWRAANKLVREGREKFDQEVIQSALRLAKKRPDKVAQALFVPNGAQRLAKVKDVISPDTYKSLLASYMDTTMQKSMTADGILLGAKFKKAIEQLGPEMHIQMFDSMEHLKNVLDVANLGEIIQAPTGGGGGMVAQLTQAGAIIDLAVGIPSGQRPKKGSGLILIGPALMGRLLSTPSGAKWFSEGVKGPIGAKQVPAQVLRLLRAAYSAQQGNRVESTRPIGGHHF